MRTRFFGDAGEEKRNFVKSNELKLPGVDLNDARKRLVDDVPFLLSLLREFVRHALPIEKALVLDGAPTTIDDDLRKLHQLRGGAGNLGIWSIEGIAARMELALKSQRSARTTPGHSDSVREMKSRLQAELFALRDALQEASVGVGEESTNTPVSSGRRAPPTPRPSASRVLIIDDSAAMRTYLRATLSKCGEPLDIIEASDGLKGFKCMSEDKPDLVLCDLNMPEFDGMKLLSIRAGRVELREIPVLMLTAEHDADRKVELLERGATDYITKPFHGGELLARLKIHLGVRKLREEVRHLRALLNDTSTSDDVTGVYNRRSFETALLEEVQRTTRYGVPLSLIVMQLDSPLGADVRMSHPTADQILSKVGLFLLQTVRSTDKAARVGQDRFAMILTHTGPAGATEMASRLCRRFPEAVGEPRGEAPGPTASFGIASSEGTPITAREMMNRAEAALEDALRHGGNRVSAFHPNLPSRTQAAGT